MVLGWFLKWARPRQLQIESLGLFLVVGGLAVEIGASHVAFAYSNDENSRLNKEAADARVVAADAESHALVLQKQVLDASNKLVEAIATPQWKMPC